MHSDACLLCGSDPWLYLGACAACSARLSARIALVAPSRLSDVQEALRDVERTQGRATANAVHDQALAQRRRYL